MQVNDQPILDQIIRGELRPCLENNKHNEKFTHKIINLNPSILGFKPQYKIDFYRYFNRKTKYYYKLITDEANNYCDRIIEMIVSDNDIRTIKYLLDDTLNKKLRTLLIDVAKLIKSNDYELNYIDPNKSDFDPDRD